MAPKVAWLIAAARAALEMRILLVMEVVAQAVAALADTAVAALVDTVLALVMAAAVVAAAPGQRAVLSLLEAMAVPLASQVAAEESSFLTVRVLSRQPPLGTNQMVDMQVLHAIWVGVRVGLSGPMATRVGSCVTKRSI